MILTFSGKINNKPTNFHRKIQSCLINVLGYDFQELNEEYGYRVDNYIPKIHTIRQDKKNKWGPGSAVHAIYVDRPNFAPLFFVKSIQTFELIHITNEKIDENIHKHEYKILIDSKPIDAHKATQLAINDGFETLSDFISFFPNNYIGKIIHWTDFKY